MFRFFPTLFSFRSSLFHTHTIQYVVFNCRHWFVCVCSDPKWNTLLFCQSNRFEPFAFFSLNLAFHRIHECMCTWLRSIEQLPKWMNECCISMRDGINKRMNERVYEAHEKKEYFVKETIKLRDVCGTLWAMEKNMKKKKNPYYSFWEHTNGQGPCNLYTYTYYRYRSVCVFSLFFFLVHLTTTNPAKSFYKCTVVKYAIHATHKRHQCWASEWSKNRNVHGKIVTSYCTTDLLQLYKMICCQPKVKKNMDQGKESVKFG